MVMLTLSQIGLPFPHEVLPCCHLAGLQEENWWEMGLGRGCQQCPDVSQKGHHHVTGGYQRHSSIWAKLLFWANARAPTCNALSFLGAQEVMSAHHQQCHYITGKGPH